MENALGKEFLILFCNIDNLASHKFYSGLWTLASQHPWNSLANTDGLKPGKA